MTVRELLIAAKKLIQSPKHWTQGSYAKDKLGRSCGVESSEAFCFCSLGALRAAEAKNRSSKDAVSTFTPNYWAAQSRLQLVVGTHVHKFNDTHTHEEVLEAFDKAIAAEKSNGN